MIKMLKKQLEAIIHPYVIFKMKEEIEKNKERDCIFLDIPLLYESHLEYLCDEIIVVYLDEQRQVQRLMARDHIDEVMLIQLSITNFFFKEKRSGRYCF